MAVTYQKLRAKIVEKYGNQCNFARNLDTSEITVSKKLCNKVAFTHKDIVKWCEILDIDQDDIGSYFFT
jgi:hypothetical protein